MSIGLHRFAVVIFAAAFAACSSDAESIDCDTATVRSFGDLDAFTHCTRCHGASRADGGVRYDTYEEAVANAEAAQETVADGSMPEGEDMPDAAKQELYVWVQCGQPE